MYGRAVETASRGVQPRWRGSGLRRWKRTAHIPRPCFVHCRFPRAVQGGMHEAVALPDVHSPSKVSRRPERCSTVRPFWISHPYVDVGTLLTPDLLHQVHKGVMKDHLIKWVTKVLEKPLMDERYVSMPDYHGLRHSNRGYQRTSCSRCTVVDGLHVSGAFSFDDRRGFARYGGRATYLP